MINVMFKMVGRNPPSILIVGGFLLIVLGVIGTTGLQGYSQFTGYGIGAVAIGAIFHLIWLWLRSR